MLFMTNPDRTLEEDPYTPLPLIGQNLYSCSFEPRPLVMNQADRPVGFAESNMATFDTGVQLLDLLKTRHASERSESHSDTPTVTDSSLCGSSRNSASSALTEQPIVTAASLSRQAPQKVSTSNRKKSKKIVPKPEESVPVEPRQGDILFGRGRHHREHPGNQRMKMIVEAYRVAYDLADREKKTEITREIVKKVKSEGNRFLKQSRKNNQLWVEVSDETSRQKVGHAMRDGRTRPSRLAMDPKILAEGLKLVPRPARIQLASAQQQGNEATTIDAGSSRETTVSSWEDI